MDGFCEQVVKKKNGIKEKIKTALALVVCACIELLFLFIYAIEPDPFWLFSVIIIAVGVVALLLFILPRINKVEFDYAVVGNKLRIDKVINKATRKKVVSIEINKVEDMDALSELHLSKEKFAKKRDCSDGNHDSSYYCIYREPDRGKCLLIFSPAENIIEGMKHSFNHDMKMKYLRRK